MSSHHRYCALAAIFLGACASTANGSDADVTVVDASISVDTADTDVVCPASPLSLDGMPCRTAGEQCGTCVGVCESCSYALCDGTRWSIVHVGPGICDAGQQTDSQWTSCGTSTCARGSLCVHTVAGGGPCRPPDDAGACGPGQVLSGTCCVTHAEWWSCATRPATCDPTLSCGCATTLCAGGDTVPSCPCATAAGSQVECGCYYP